MLSCDFLGAKLKSRKILEKIPETIEYLNIFLHTYNVEKWTFLVFLCYAFLIGRKKTNCYGGSDGRTLKMNHRAGFIPKISKKMS